MYIKLNSLVLCFSLAFASNRGNKGFITFSTIIALIIGRMATVIESPLISRFALLNILFIIEDFLNKDIHCGA